MNFRIFLVLAVVVCAVQQISAFNFCNCKDQGKDVCSCKKSVTAPRPYPLTPPRPQRVIFKSICKEQAPAAPKPFGPIGDACSCGQQIVKPAPLPRPQLNLPKLTLPTHNCPCKNNQQPANSGCGHAIRAPEEYQNYDNDGATIYFETSRKKAATPSKPRYAPADVVSIAIAQRLANSAKNGVSERQLQYGSLKEPTVDIKSDRKQSNINEESFYDTRGNVLEIQPFIFKTPKDQSSEESSSEEDAPKKPKQQAFDPARLEFEEIGYKSYQPAKHQRDEVIRNSEPVKHECNKQQRQSRPRHSHNQGQSCDCHRDLVVDRSTSDQSSSFETIHPRVRT